MAAIKKGNMDSLIQYSPEKYIIHNPPSNRFFKRAGSHPTNLIKS